MASVVSVKELTCWAVASVAVGMMFLATRLAEEPEMLFPEVGALAVGLVVVDKRVWSVRGWAAPLLMAMAALLGVSMVRYVCLPLAVQLLIGFASVATLLTVSRSGLAPAISACLLPILTGVTSWLYPLSVLGVTAVLVGMQWALERLGLRHELPAAVAVEPYVPCVRSLKTWGACLMALAPVLAFFQWVDWRFAMAPPLVVTFVEFATSRSGLRMRPLLTWGLLVGAASIGSAARLSCGGLPVEVVAAVVFVLILLLFRAARKPFAPAAAIALVPFILPESEVAWFVLRVAAGAGSLILLAKGIGKLVRMA